MTSEKIDIDDGQGESCATYTVLAFVPEIAMFRSMECRITQVAKPWSSDLGVEEKGTVV